jgi:plastocyanin
MMRITALAVAAALVPTLAACGGGGYGGGSKSTSSTTSSSSGGGGYGGAYGKSTTKTGGAAAATGRAKEVELYDYRFDPKTITGKPGSTVKIKLKNESKAGKEHNFSVDSQKIEKDVEAGKNATVSVKIPASGSVQFYCKYHKSLGMTGVLKAS